MKTIRYVASVLEGQLYQINTEDGRGITFDCLVTVDVQGTTYVHKTFYASGKGTDSEVGDYVRQSRSEAQAFADKVNARGRIDLAYWELLVDHSDSLEERWAGYAAEEDSARLALGLHS